MKCKLKLREVVFIALLLIPSFITVQHPIYHKFNNYNIISIYNYILELNGLPDQLLLLLIFFSRDFGPEMRSITLI